MIIAIEKYHLDITQHIQHFNCVIAFYKMIRKMRDATRDQCYLCHGNGIANSGGINNVNNNNQDIDHEDRVSAYQNRYEHASQAEMEKNEI